MLDRWAIAQRLIIKNKIMNNHAMTFLILIAIAFILVFTGYSLYNIAILFI